jgi:hypothetical protein
MIVDLLFNINMEIKGQSNANKSLETNLKDPFTLKIIISILSISTKLYKLLIISKNYFLTKKSLNLHILVSKMHNMTSKY